MFAQKVRSGVGSELQMGDTVEERKDGWSAAGSWHRLLIMILL